MNVFSIISIMAFMIYLLIGLYALHIDRRSKLNQLFFAFCLSMSVWSFAYAFVYAGQDRNMWMKISAVGWCTFSSFVLHLTLLVTENKMVRNTAVKLLLYVPSALFFYISVFLYRNDKAPSAFIEKFFNIGDFTYHFTFLLASIILVFVWGCRSKSMRRRKQAGIVIVVSLVPFSLNLLTQTILPAFGITVLPLMGHIYSLIMIFGIFYVMVRYRMFTTAPKLLVEELLQEMMDIVILLSEECRIIRTNNYTEKLLGYSSGELQDKHLSLILQQEFITDISHLSHGSGIYRLSEVHCKGKSGMDIPVSLSCSPIIDPYLKDILGYVIVGQDISLVKHLEQEITDNKKAEEKIRDLAYHDSLTGLPNRKYFYEMLGKAVDKANMEGQGFAVLFL
ncbi:MAG: histidine kinase N-terminal 7TM domain-containing protein, partial [Pseudomonadota bacterium]